MTNIIIVLNFVLAKYFCPIRNFFNQTFFFPLLILSSAKLAIKGRQSVPYKIRAVLYHRVKIARIYYLLLFFSGFRQYSKRLDDHEIIRKRQIVRTYTKLEQACMMETDLLQSYFTSSLPCFRQFAGRFGDQGSRSSKKVRSVSSTCFGISVSRCSK